MKKKGMIPKRNNIMKYAFVLLASFIACMSVHAQETIKIKGSLVDFISSTPIENANISVKGVVGLNVESSENGEFEIGVPSKNSIIIVKRAGYKLKEFPLWGNDKVVISLMPESLQLDDYEVVLPYNKDVISDLNGAYSVISKSYDKTIQYRDIYQLMEASVPGLDVSSFSGVPGEGSNFNIRGIRSLYAGNEPLIVIDGVPVVNQTFNNSVANGNFYNYLADINVKDIESVTVLRDAAAAGIYGSRASNGAIVITTKQGTNGKSFLDVSVQQGMSLRFDEIPVLNSSEYLSYFTDKLYQQGLDNSSINSMYPFLNNTNTNTVEYWQYANNTNWQKEVTRGALSQDYYFNLRGGDVKSKYSLHIGYNDTEGVMKGVDLGRFTTRFNLDFRISKKFTAGMRMGFVRTSKNLMDQGYSEHVNPYYLSLIKSPMLAPYQKSNQGVDGPFLSQPDFAMISNPIAVVNGVKNEVTNTWILGSVYAQYEFSKNLKTKVNLSIDRKGLEEDRFTPANGLVPLNGDPRFDRTSEEQAITDRIMRVEQILSYNKYFNTGNSINAIIGYNLEMSEYQGSYGFTVHSSSDEFQGLGDGLKISTTGINESYRNLSLFANAEYMYLSKFFVKGGLRLDGSSRFGENADGLKIGSSPFAVLPYVGLKWKLKAEPWINDIQSIDEFDIRASWGLTANQNIPVNARYSLYSDQFYKDRPGIAPVALGNSEIKWETTSNLNFGFDLSLLKKALGINIDVYSNKTTDLLLPQNIDGSNGFNTYWSNGGTLKNSGVELGLSTFGHKGDWSWNLLLSVAKNTNKIESLPNGLSIEGGENGFISSADVGEEFGLIYGYENLGVYSSDSEVNGLINENGILYHAGDFRFADQNNDGIINHSDLVVIGNPNPDLFGGIRAGVSYKNFNLDAAFTYSYGNEILNVLRMKLENASAYENQSASTLGRWMKEGDQTDIPNTKYGDPSKNGSASDYYIEDGSYLKLKSLSLCYNMDKRISFIRNAQVYITGYNLFTVTKYLGVDPEVVSTINPFSRGYDFGMTPTPKMFMLGIKLSL